jgi:hypothetical protein
LNTERTKARSIKRLSWLGLTLLCVAAILTLYHEAVPAWGQPRRGAAISEFMACNSSTLADEDGDRVDWIEIHNRGRTELDLGGWYLTDNDNAPTRWQFPPTRLAADGYLVVYASGKDRAVAGSPLHTNFRLATEGEYLALITPDGTIASEYVREHLPQFADVSYGIDAALNERYFTSPTPGAANGTAEVDQGPILSAAGHVPARLASQDALTVTVAAKSRAPITAVALHYRVMYGDTVDTGMYDDGAHGDGRAGDGVYGAIIPGMTARPGEMIRYFITAEDAAGHRSRWPWYNDPRNSPQYMGTMAAAPEVSSALQVLYWFVEDPAAAETDEGTRASVFYVPAGTLADAPSDGALYDNVLVRLRGISARSWPKKSLKFDFNQGYPFRFSTEEEPVEEFNLNTIYSDKAYIRQVLAWETYRDAGVPYCESFPVRVQQNGAFHSVALFLEQPDERYLARQGLDPNGALYKMYNPLDSSTLAVQKRTRLNEDNHDLQVLVNGVRLLGPVRTNYLFDHVDIPAVVNYLAATALMHDNDHVNLNYYLYRDTEGTGEWTFLPWDKDLTFGRNNLKDHRGVLNDVIWADHDPQSHPLFGDAEHPRINGNWNSLINAFYATPSIREMYLRRLRTLMDELLQAPGTPREELYYERRIDELVAQMSADVALDAARWPVEWGEAQTFSQAIEILEREYLAVRRAHLYETHGPASEGIIPAAQPAKTRVVFGLVEYAPASGDQDEEYVTLVNPNGYAADLSGWAIDGDVRYRFRPGIVIPAGGTLYVSPNVVAFRNRAVSPSGGEGRYVQGNYQGRLSNVGGAITLYNADGVLVDARSFLTLSPSPP